MNDASREPGRSLIGFITGGNAPPVVLAPTNRGWMSATRGDWANRCLPLLIANQSGWELRTPSAFTATPDGAGERVPWQGDYTWGSHADGDAGPGDHRTRRDLCPFVQSPQDQSP